MDIRNCKNCGRMFNYMGSPVCPNCVNTLEDVFQQVKKYVEDNPGANIQTVAEENEVSVHQIRQWIRQERLAFSDDSQVGLNCEKCGTLIKTGRFCDQCKMNLGNAFADAIREPQKPAFEKKKKESARMRFLDNK